MLFSDITRWNRCQKILSAKAPPAPQAAARTSLPETHISADTSSKVLSDSRPEWISGWYLSRGSVMGTQVVPLFAECRS